MNIVFFSHLEQIREHAAYATALKRLTEVNACLIVMGTQEQALGTRLGAFDDVIDILPPKHELDQADALAQGTGSALRDLEERIGSRFINRDIAMDRYFRSQPRLDVAAHSAPLIWSGARAKHLLYQVYLRLEVIYTDVAPDFVFVETSSAPSRLAWRLAQLHDIPAGVFMAVRFWPDRLYLETGIGYDWQQARAAYAEISEEPMIGDELDIVTQRLQTIRTSRSKPDYLKTMHARGLPGIVNKLRPKQRLEGLALWLGKRAGTYRRHPRVLPGKMFSPLAQFRRYVAGRRSKRYLQTHTTSLPEIQKTTYAVYFLHVQPELTVEEMAFDYSDQVTTLRHIAAALPADTCLVVKEHSPMLGYRPLDVYSRLVHTPGVLIADTQTDSHELISGAKVVVTLTGTVALEALLYKVPAIVLGDIYFDEFDGINKPHNLDELKQLLANPDLLPRPTQSDAVRMLGSLRRASRPGLPARVDVSLGHIDQQSAHSILDELQRLQRPAF